MNLAFLYGSWSLTFRKTLDFASIYDDPRGLTGSEYGIIRTAEECARLGHEVTLYTNSSDTRWGQLKIAPLDQAKNFTGDAAIVWNEPDLLREIPARVRVCEQMVNSFEYCKVGFYDFVDLWISPSKQHRDMILSKKHDVAWTSGGDPAELYTPEPDKWCAVDLGCDPDRLGNEPKVPGRVVYCSSPDRGLHWLLQVWPAVKRAVPDATLEIFYRLKPWIDGFNSTAYFPPIEPLRARALFVQEALRRMTNHGITLRDSVSRNEIHKQLSRAQILAYPCDTTRWSEGFSCTILEACAARACPVISDCDALGELYAGVLPMVRRGQWDEFRDLVIEHLRDEKKRALVNERARAFAEERTWKKHSQTLCRLIDSRLSSRPSSPTPEPSKTSSTSTEERTST